MDFLYRSPLFDFNPRNEQEINENWAKICTAIQYSSASLFAEINDKMYADLSPKIKAKLLKYILRGRYRPTPFGNLAGVGFGEFKKDHCSPIDLRSLKELKSGADYLQISKSSVEKFSLADGIHDRYGLTYFLSYIEAEERWGYVSLPFNKFFKFLIKKIQNMAEIDLDIFLTILPDFPSIQVKDIWEQMLAIGILQPVDSQKLYKRARGQDSILTTSISLPETMIEDFETLRKSGGNLFLKSPNTYLQAFSNWFSCLFDDRSVSLELLMKEYTFVTGAFYETRHPVDHEHGEIEYRGSLWNEKSVDLKKLVPEEKLNTSLFDLQIAFRLGKGNLPIVENIVGNRPFVYYGRFNWNEKIYSLEKKLKETIFTSTQVLYAELIFCETQAIQMIGYTKRLFDYYITALPDSSERAIVLKDIYITLHEEKIVLIHRFTQKEIIPIVLHPLNGKEISHPAMRFLWEVSNQNVFKFLPYLHKGFLESNYSPQLNWGKVVLQTRRWFIHFKNFRILAHLRDWLESKDLPCPILAGYLDRELLLDWKEGTELSILWNEMQKIGKIVLSDPLWLDNQDLKSEKGVPVYPQFIYHLSQSKQEVKLEVPKNPITRSDKNCLYIILRCPHEEVIEFLRECLTPSFLEKLRKKNIKWYFLFYPEGKQLQIRIRFLGIHKTKKNKLLSSFMRQIGISGIHVESRSYYPETAKYGSSGYRISESLFHIESEFLLGTDSEILCPLTWKKNEKAGFILHLWESVLPETGLLIPFYQTLKKAIKNTEYSIFKRIQKEYQDCIESETDGDLITSYLRFLTQNELLYQSKSAGINLLLNHLHMQVNRFFPGASKETELGIHYQLCRRLGRKIFVPNKVL